MTSQTSAISVMSQPNREQLDKLAVFGCRFGQKKCRNLLGFTIGKKPAIFLGGSNRYPRKRIGSDNGQRRSGYFSCGDVLYLKSNSAC